MNDPLERVKPYVWLRYIDDVTRLCEDMNFILFKNINKKFYFSTLQDTASAHIQAKQTSYYGLCCSQAVRIVLGISYFASK